MAKKRRFDKFKFLVEIDGFVEAGFQKAGPLKTTVEVSEYREGGSTFPDKDPGLANVDNLVLERGSTESEELYQWFKNILDGVGGEGGVDKRNLAIIQQDRAGNEISRWNVYNCFPISFQAGDWDATTSEKNIESVELAIDEPPERG